MKRPPRAELYPLRKRPSPLRAPNAADDAIARSHLDTLPHRAGQAARRLLINLNFRYTRATWQNWFIRATEPA